MGSRNGPEKLTEAQGLRGSQFVPQRQPMKIFGYRDEDEVQSDLGKYDSGSPDAVEKLSQSVVMRAELILGC